jgi:CubicO group peptidase (beta-lactamase class C family)
VVSLIEEGQLKMSTTARSVLGMDLPLIDDEVTVEHLLAHRSGIGDYFDEEIDRPDALRERQRKHRLYAAVEPRERPDANTDPWQLAFDGLQHLSKIRNFAIKAANVQKHLEAVQEIIRQLAVGRED